MYTAWTKHLKTPEDRLEFQKTIVRAKPVLDHLRSLLKDENQAAEDSEMGVKQFDNPNWAYKQAYRNGCKSIIHMIDKLIDLNQQRTPTNEPIPSAD